MLRLKNKEYIFELRARAGGGEKMKAWKNGAIVGGLRGSTLGDEAPQAIMKEDRKGGRLVQRGGVGDYDE